MRRRLLACVIAAAVALTGWWSWSAAHRPEPRIGLFTSLPIVWNEADDLKGMVDAPAGAHWARGVLEKRGKLVPLDTLFDLLKVDQLVIAQPRPLVPEENVSLDAWVRRGGRLLMFADPMLTQESAFALGDRRRPQDVALVSPILARWGLQLQFDESQAGGLRENTGEHLPINLAGSLSVIPGGHDARCAIGMAGLVARCEIGRGHAVLVADAAVLESAPAHDAELAKLLDEAFPY
jgi:hypothetical protein